MKRTERHHLKQNQVALTLQQTLHSIEENRRLVTGLLAAVIVLAIAAGGYMWWRQQRDTKAATMLGEAMVIAEAQVAPIATTGSETPPAGSYPTERAKLEAALPKFIAAAEAYPRTPAGLAARYHAAATLVALGREEEAAKRYQEVIEMAGDRVYGRVARLGLAEVQVRQRKYEPAINTFKELSLNTNGELPVDGVLMQLGRTYLLAGRKPEAAQAFKRITDEFPASLYAADARRELDALSPAASDRRG
jgi:predicted negative regulator of RcsB-dependent stress response